MENDVVIKVDDITKDYGNNRGNFDISFDLHVNEALGIVGENGAGKTTLLRQIMGFIHSDKGSIKVFNLDAYKDAAQIKNYVGYVPGEINFPDYKTGNIFLHEFGKLFKQNDFNYADSLIKRLQLDITAYPKRMSKGMKQKTAIVTALMLNAPIILMDEPTTGLDPLMRDEFLKITLEEKQKGSTILMSSNTISELERVCDRVIMISKGRIVGIADVNQIKNVNFRDYKIEFNDNKDFKKFTKEKFDIIRIQENYNQVTIRINKENINELFDKLKKYKVKFITQNKYDLQTYFNEKLNIKGGK